MIGVSWFTKYTKLLRKLTFLSHGNNGDGHVEPQDIRCEEGEEGQQGKGVAAAPPRDRHSVVGFYVCSELSDEQLLGQTRMR